MIPPPRRLQRLTLEMSLKPFADLTDADVTVYPDHGGQRQFGGSDRRVVNEWVAVERGDTAARGDRGTLARAD